MLLQTQAEFIKKCTDKYWFTEIPDDQKWEKAHYPFPECSGEDDTVLLWSADHTVQGLLQSVELDHKCFYHSANSKDLYNLETYYPEYLELFQQLKFKFNSRQGKIGGSVTGRKHAENKTGICSLSFEEHSANSRKSVRITNAQRWQCLVTGHISSPGPLSRYQNKRGIETKLRVKLALELHH
jgi:hypothetical protein